MIRKHMSLLALAICATLAACAPNQPLQQSQLYGVAPTKFDDAEQNQQRATLARRQGNMPLAEHYEYIARRQLEIAQARNDRQIAINQRQLLEQQLGALENKQAVRTPPR
jgi:hypothetical protein